MPDLSDRQRRMLNDAESTFYVAASALVDARAAIGELRAAAVITDEEADAADREAMAAIDTMEDLAAATQR